MEKFLNKKYQIDRIDDSYDAYLEAIGLSAERRHAAKDLKAAFKLVQISANEYSLNTDVGPRTLETKFVLNQEIERTTMDGRKVKSTYTIDGNKLIERQTETNRDVTTIRTFSDNELVVESVVGDIRSKVWCVLVE
ncbi:hypothetical protein HA402_000108 [Bradysia odoriphaga]|nr:hypothetical protein HA402_000108 [Bradysia odoriphaga]